MILLLRVAVSLHLVDLVLSSVLLSLGWMQEANPLAAYVYSRFGVGGLAVMKLVTLTAAVVIIGRAIATHPRLARIACLIALGSGTLAVVLLLIVAGIWLSTPDALAETVEWTAIQRTLPH